MEVLELDGKRYVKASVIAKELGYTSDYVGQLCRSGKIDAQLVGRSWYVDESSVRTHKTSRYRSSKTKTKEALKVEINKISTDEAKEETRSIKPKVSSHQHFYGRAVPKQVKYDEDVSELIPMLSEKENNVDAQIEVKVAGAENLQVATKAKSYALKATDLPRVRFKGSLSVEEASGQVETTEESKEDEKEVPKTPAKEEKTAKTEAVHLKVNEKPKKKGKASKLSPETNNKTKTKRLKVAFEDEIANEICEVPVHIGTRAPGLEHKVAPVTSELHIHPVETPTLRLGRATFIYVSTSLIAAIVLAMSFIAVEQSIVSDGGELKEVGYDVNLSSALDSIHRLK